MAERIVLNITNRRVPAFGGPLDGTNVDVYGGSYQFFAPEHNALWVYTITGTWQGADTERIWRADLHAVLRVDPNKPMRLPEPPPKGKHLIG